MRKLAVAIALFVGCTNGGGKLPPSAECEEASDCEDGLTCEPFATFQGDVCMEHASICTRTCETMADCADLGPTFRCFANCDGMFCGDTAAP